MSVNTLISVLVVIGLIVLVTHAAMFLRRAFMYEYTIQCIEEGYAGMEEWKGHYACVRYEGEKPVFVLLEDLQEPR